MLPSPLFRSALTALAGLQLFWPWFLAVFAVVVISTLPVASATGVAASGFDQLPATAHPSTTMAAPLRVLIVGDSITHGHEADYTWRYRLWQWFQENDEAVEFVGPFAGTNPPDMADPVGDSSADVVTNSSSHSPSPPSDSSSATLPQHPRGVGRYAADVDPSFVSHDDHHFALWGYQANQAKMVIDEVVTAHKPDLLLVALGFNDLGWFVSGPDGTLASMRTLVDRARAVQPHIRFALANVPQRTRLGGRDDLPVSTGVYNTLLTAACRDWSTKESPVHLVRLRETYDCDVDSCPAAYDGLHPNALGEYQIARAFSQTLHMAYGIGQTPLSVPTHVPPRPCPVPANLRVRPVGDRIVATWDHAFGAYGYYAYNRAVGAHDWQGTEFVTVRNRSDTMWIAPGIPWEFKIQADCGSGLRSAFTEPRSAMRTAGQDTSRTESTNGKTDPQPYAELSSGEQKPLAG